MSPEDIVVETMKSHAPGGKVSFREVVSARKIGAGRSQQIYADLIMFDGQPAKLRLEKWQYGWSHQWLELPGGPIEMVGDSWQRANP